MWAKVGSGSASSAFMCIGRGVKKIGDVDPLAIFGVTRVASSQKVASGYLDCAVHSVRRLAVARKGWLRVFKVKMHPLLIKSGTWILLSSLDLQALRVARKLRLGA
jgi:hypothetical protein